MFDWRKQVQILKAEHALRDGRLDEAYAIASQKELQDWRGCQVLLEKLVDPLLDRAAVHLAEGRLEDASADVERARAAGGNRPRVAALRAEVQGRRDEKRRGEARERELVASARRHLAHGSVGAGMAVLAEADTSDPEARRLKREAERREERAREACARAETLLKDGALLESLSEAREAREAFARSTELPPLLLKLKAAALPSLEKALDDGSLGTADRLLESLTAACGESLEARRSAEALDLCRQAASAVESKRYEAAEATLGRLRQLLPRARWVETAEDAVRAVAEKLQELRSNPLSSLADSLVPGGFGGAHPTVATPRVRPKPGPGPVSAPHALRGAGRCAGDHSGAAGRHLLLVDGVGSFLLLRSDRITLGREGSSAHPEVGLPADIAGIQAEILRVDDDYFVAAHGIVDVNGRRVEKKLLAGGDRIELSPRCGLVFRLPNPLSSSAVLSLSGGMRIAGDVREVILLDRHLLIGAGENCHVRATAAPCQIILGEEDRGWVLRAEAGIDINGKPQGTETVVEQGAQVKIGDVTFTLTLLEGQR